MTYISTAIFIFTAAMAAGSILLTTRLIEEYQLPFLRSLLYYILFTFTFGFYGIWGQFIIITLAGERLDPALYSTISVFSLLLGLPFLIFSWMMSIKFAAEAAGIRLSGYFIPFFIVINLAIIGALAIGIINLEFSEALPLFRYYYIGAALIFALIAALLLARGKSLSPARGDRVILSVLLTGGALAQALVLLLVPDLAWMALIFVFLLFATVTMPALWLSYRSDLKPVATTDLIKLPGGIENFFSKNDISPREADIIREICNGLSNQEIADKLFISLQTVKDHTSRIYLKTNVRNRMQLMTTIQKLESKVQHEN